MSGSGLVYVAILAACGVWFASRSMRSGGRETLVAPDGTVLSRRGAVTRRGLPAGQINPGGSYALLRPVAQETTPVVKRRQIAAAVPPPARLRVSAATATRRRRVLGVLGALFLGTLIPAALGVLPPWVTLLAAAPPAGYLLELRAATTRARRRLQARTVPGRPHRGSSGLRHRRREDVETWDPWPSFETIPGPVSDLAAGWEPRPVPLPTYVTAAKAEPIPGRRIEIPAGRAWTGAPDMPTPELSVVPATSGAGIGTAATLGAGIGTAPLATPSAEPAVAAAAAELELEFEHKRAVND